MAIDDAVRALVYSKYITAMDLTDMNLDTVFAPPQLAKRMIAEKRGSQTTEFINIWREESAFGKDRFRAPLLRSEFEIYPDPLDLDNVALIRSMPQDLRYKVSIHTKDLDKINAVDIINTFWRKQNPNLDMTLAGTYPLGFDLFFTDLKNESDMDKYAKGLVFVYSFEILVEGWLFTLSSGGTINTIICDFYSVPAGSEVGEADELLSRCTIE